MTELKLTKTDELFSRIEESLSSYSQNGLLDTGRFFSEIKFILSKLGIASYDFVDELIHVKNHKAELDCSFYMLDSAWLCDETPTYDLIIPQPESRLILYSQKTCETIAQNTCGNNIPYRADKVIIESCPGTCNNEQILEKVSYIDYVQSSVGFAREWRNPRPMIERVKKSLKGINNHTNHVAASPLEFSIERQGQAYNLFTTLKNPIVYLKYYRYPIDDETGLPLIPEEPIIQKYIEYHLMHHFFHTMWLNGESDIERKIQDLEIKRNQARQEALNWTTIPSMKMLKQMAERVRRKTAAYEVMRSVHY